MPETKTLAASIAISPKLLALTPRQVSLAKKETKRTPTASPMETKTLLLLSIAQYLQSNGFSKTLKKFRSEAQLEEVSFKGSTLDLEEICLNYLKTAGHAATKNGLEKGGTHMIGEGDLGGSLLEVLDRKKKKRSGESNVDTANHHTEEMKNDAVNEKVKAKEKKKSKKNSDFPGKDSKMTSLKELEESAGDVICGLQSDEITVKGKNKKSKGREQVSESPVPRDLASFEGNSSKEVKKSKNRKEKSKHKSDDDEQHTAKERQDDDETKAENAVCFTKTSDEGIKVKKVSKKRKRLESEENGCKPVDHDTLDEPKRRKGGDVKDDKADRQLAKLKASGISKGVDDTRSNGQNGQCNRAEETPIKHFDGSDNVKEEDGEESAKRKNMKKQHNGSAEPTAAKAFQRIKVDEVVYADDRLKDNSYWAKDGAESGYGAKAQEVLGQVRGRDFRHEKTKKKRGTYRGGQIDLHSHSVKFNYSDDE
ncbi:lisH domain-containing protein C1711.05 [Rhodamnia argentea]|uniref:LisH domain-containing protein C1711.05 n=1 Tax=Rhodamnia argentea TaxID=178133 RepID=A0A8B8QCT4_9MYRT|nr:lisH domain-containing protein C1711.05 [Rhodamnia argentea]